MSRATTVLLAVAGLILVIGVIAVALDGGEDDGDVTAQPTETGAPTSTEPGVDDTASPSPTETQASPSPSPTPSPTPTATETDRDVVAGGSTEDDGDGGTGDSGDDGEDGDSGEDGDAETGDSTDDGDDDVDDMPNTGGGLAAVAVLTLAGALGIRRRS